MKRTNETAKAAMKLAHQIKKYFSSFAAALTSAWAQIKSGAKKMIELTGTEKQIAYANDLLSAMWSSINSYIAECNQKLEKYETRQLETGRDISRSIESVKRDIADAEFVIEQINLIHSSAVSAKRVIESVTVETLTKAPHKIRDHRTLFDYAFSVGGYSRAQIDAIII